MKKSIGVLLIAVIGVFLFSSLCLASDNTIYPGFNITRIVIGEKEAEINYKPAQMETPAYVKNGRTLVPFRFLGEALGADVTWHGENRQAVLKLGGKEVIVTIGSKAAYIDGKIQTLDVPAEIKDGRTFIPLRFVSESFGAYVEYDADREMVEVSYVDTTDWKEYTAPLSGLKYKHPDGWDVEIIENDTKVLITSPRGSKMWVYWAKEKPEDVREILQRQAEEYDWEFIDELFNDPEDINKGFNFGYDKLDYQSEVLYRYAVYVDPLAEGSHVSEMILINDDYFRMENGIMLAIAYS